MRHIHPLLSTLLPTALALLSCAEIPPIPAPEDEIVFRSEGLAPDTKAAQVTALSSFYVSAVTGTPGTDTEAWTSAQFDKVGTTAAYKGGKYWPGSDPSYRFYASNLPLTFDAAGPTVAATNATDAVCAYLASPTYRGSSNALTFNHIFARISTVTVSADSDYTISDVTVWIRDIKTGGTYNLLTGAGHDDGTGWSGLTPTTSADTEIFREADSIAPGASSTGSDNALCFVPGEYVLVATWTASADSYTGTLTAKESPAQTFAAGEEQTIAITLSGGEIVVKIGPADDSGDDVQWASAFSPSAFSVAPGKTVEFSPGNLQATTTDLGSTWTWSFAANQWSYIGNAAANTAINGVGTVSANGTVDLFGWNGASSSNDSWGINNSTSDASYGNSVSDILKTDWGAIPAVVSALGDDWRTPSRAEWGYLFNTRATPSGIRYAKATVNSVPGVILLPDNWSTSYYTLASANTASADYTANTISLSDWTSKLEAHGAIFLPAAGNRNGASIYDVGSGGVYWSSTASSTTHAYTLSFSSSSVYPWNIGYRHLGFSVRLVRDTNPHLFSISDSAEAEFSPGNLQYQASTGAWRFAEHQWDYVGDGGTTGGNVSGSSNTSVSSSYSGWIDLFGWGTSGHAFSSGYGTAYLPYSTSATNTDYGPTDGTSGLTATYELGDWGVKNAIGSYPAGTWRTPSRAEWVYLFNTRATPSGIRYAKATVNGVVGMILLPDDWSASYYTLSSTNTASADYTANTISASDWTSKLEAHGAIFLPAAGNRFYTSIFNAAFLGLYWSSTAYSTTNAHYLRFSNSVVSPQQNHSRTDGFAVRLLRTRDETRTEVTMRWNPLYYVAESNVKSYNSSTKVVTLEPDPAAAGLRYGYNWSTAMSYFAKQNNSYNTYWSGSTVTDGSTNGFRYHLPVRYELYTIIPTETNVFSNSFQPSGGLVSTSTTCIFGFNTETQAGIADWSYWSTFTTATVRYAIRFLGTNYCSVWKYQLSGKVLTITAKLIDRVEKTDGSLSSILNTYMSMSDSWWDTQSENNGQQRKFYATGYYGGSGSGGNGYADSEKDLHFSCWSATEFDAASVYTFDFHVTPQLFCSNHAKYWGWMVRLFRE